MSPPFQPLMVNVVQYSNPNGNQQSNGKNKGHGKKKDKGGKGNVNKHSEETSAGKKESKNKFKFPCKLLSGDNLTHIFPKIQDDHFFLSQQVSSTS